MFLLPGDLSRESHDIEVNGWTGGNNPDPKKSADNGPSISDVFLKGECDEVDQICSVIRCYTTRL